MKSSQALAGAAILLIVIPVRGLMAQEQPSPSAAPTFRLNSTLVFLDVTVLDKQGRPVVSGLTKDDFIITEDKRPQRIFSFEAPETHAMSPSAADNNPDGKAPVTIFVLDLLNSSFEDFAFIRYSVRRYLAEQPKELTSPAELMLLGNRSLETLQSFTRSRADLLDALDHLSPAVPYKWLSGSFIEERFDQSIDALQQIALQNKGITGRKNIVWVGHGGPTFITFRFTGAATNDIKRYMHETTNMLVDARISLFLIYPGLKIGHFVGTSISGPGVQARPVSAADAEADIGSGEPFAGDVNFGVFVNETGGKLFYNRNDVDAEMRQSEQLGSEYYTLTYQPHGAVEDGKFRRIRVTLRDPNLRAVTKTGYYAPDKNALVSPLQQALLNLVEASRSTVPYAGLEMKISQAVRQPERRSVEFTVLLKGKNLDWRAAQDGTSTANILLSATSLTGSNGVLASKAVDLTLSGATQDPARLAAMVTPVTLTIRVPRKTESVRVVTEATEGGPIGSADLVLKTVNAAAATPIR